MNNYNNDKDKRQQMYTTGRKFYSSWSDNVQALFVTYSGEYMRLEFVPPLAGASRDGGRMFDHEHKTITALDHRKANLLADMYFNKVRDTIIENKEYSECFQLGDSNLIVIGNKIGEDGNPVPYITLHKNLSEEDHLPEITKTYLFNRIQVGENFNPENGTMGSTSVSYTYESDVFFTEMKAFVEASSSAYTHIDRVIGKYANDKLLENINAIGRKLGLELPTGGSGYAGKGGRGNIFNSFQNNSTTPDSNVESYGSLDDMDDIPF